MNEFTPRNQIAFPSPGSNIKQSSSPSKLADDMRNLAFTADQAVERAGARNSQHVLDELQAVDNRVQGNTRLAQEAHQRVDSLGSRFTDLETMNGVAPGDPTDAALNLILGNHESVSRGTLDGIYAARLSSGVRPEDHGAIGDGIANDTEAMETALAEATGTFPRPLILGSGKIYRINRRLSTQGAHVTILGDGALPATILAPAHYDNVLHIEANPPIRTTQLAESVTINTRRWLVDDATGVTAGMLMKVQSSKSWYFDPRPEANDARKGELHLVERVEGNAVWTRDLSNDGYDLLSETVDITFKHPVHVHLENFLIKGVTDPGETRTTGITGVVVYDAIEPHLARVSVEGLPYTGIRLRECYRPVIDGGHVFDANGTSTGYGVHLQGCRNALVKDALYSGTRRAVDVSGDRIPSIGTRITRCINLGGGVRADGIPYGWDHNHALGAANYGFGSHGPADHTTYENCVTANIHIPYSLRGGNETIDGATHFGSTRGGFLRLATGEHITVRDVKLYAMTHQTPKETSRLDTGPGMNHRRPDCFMLVTPEYNYATSRVHVENIDCEVQDAFVMFQQGTVFSAHTYFGDIRAIYATQDGSIQCAFFYHDGPLANVGTGWTIGLLDRRRRGGVAGHALTKNVNIEGARYIAYGVATSTS